MALSSFRRFFGLAAFVASSPPLRAEIPPTVTSPVAGASFTATTPVIEKSDGGKPSLPA